MQDKLCFEWKSVLVRLCDNLRIIEGKVVLFPYWYGTLNAHGQFKTTSCGEKSPQQCMPHVATDVKYSVSAVIILSGIWQIKLMHSYSPGIVGTVKKNINFALHWLWMCYSWFINKYYSWFRVFLTDQFMSFTEINIDGYMHIQDTS